MTDASGEYHMMAPPSDGVKENQAMTKVRANPSYLTHLRPSTQPTNFSVARLRLGMTGRAHTRSSWRRGCA
jgi:hypothetical protein